MKINYILFIFFLTLLSCRKESTKPNFSGKWEYVEIIGYPFHSTYLPPGNGNYLIIDVNGNYERKINDSLIFKGKYSIMDRKDCDDEKSKNFFLTNDSYTDSRFIELHNEQLVLFSTNCVPDINALYYRRVE